MHESSDLESYGEGHRTFDCPWCGAISGIDPSHIGEHYDCPECHKATKLTPQNTRQTELTQPPGEAAGDAKAKPPKPVAHEVSDWESYGKGHRTFDCPWCGAISGIDPSHLGESFTCPECHESTKLTPDNTRPGHVTEPPPDAPHHEEKPARSPALLVVALALVAAIVGVLVATGGDDGGGTGPTDDGKQAAKAPDVDPSTPGPDVDPVKPPVDPDAGSGTDTPEPDDPPDVEEPPPGPDPAVLARKAELERALETAKLEHEAAEKAIEDWKAALEPELLERLGLLEACNDMRLEADRLCQSYPGPDATQEEARAYNAVMRAFVAADPKRVEAATRVTMQLNSERLKPRFLETWESVNFYLPYVRKTMGDMEAAGQCVESEEYGVLVQRLRKAEADVETAEKALADLPGVR